MRRAGWVGEGVSFSLAGALLRSRAGAWLVLVLVTSGYGGAA